MECWSAGVMECWSAGVVEWWSGGRLGDGRGVRGEGRNVGFEAESSEKGEPRQFCNS